MLERSLGTVCLLQFLSQAKQILKGAVTLLLSTTLRGSMSGIIPADWAANKKKVGMRKLYNFSKPSEYISKP